MDRALSFPGVAVVAIAYAAMLSALALWVPEEHFFWMFSEAGPFEELSIVFWLILAGLCFVVPGVSRRALAVPGLLAIIAAAREADLHKAFTLESMFKSHYYLKSAAPLMEKAIAAVVALTILALLAYALVLGWRQVRRGAWQLDWARTAMLATAGLFVCKVLDRMKSVVGEWTGYVFSMTSTRFIAAFEEGFECAMPVLFMIALLQYQSLLIRYTAELPDLSEFYRAAR